MSGWQHPLRPVQRYRTAGGGVVTWTHTPNETHGGFRDWGSWTCNGCGASEARAQRSAANEHAGWCRAIPEME